MSLLIEFPQYRCAKQVGALKIAHTLPNPRGVELHFENTRYAPIQVDAAWFDQHKVTSGGYLVVCEGVAPVFIPGDLFELLLSPVEGGAA